VTLSRQGPGVRGEENEAGSVGMQQLNILGKLTSASDRGRVMTERHANDGQRGWWMMMVEATEKDSRSKRRVG
jgi:hypothetical protein